jgi:DNA-binding MarR family transcriptional regulator
MAGRHVPPITLTQAMHRAATRLRRAVEQQVLDPADVSWSAYEVLHTLLRDDARTPRDVAGVIGVPAPTLTAIIKRLADDDLILRVPDVHDRRVIHLRLTKYGRSLVIRLAAQVQTVEAMLLRNIPSTDLAAAEPAIRRLQPAEVDRRGAQRASGAALRQAVEAPDHPDRPSAHSR